jgi:hypothetical protein
MFDGYRIIFWGIFFVTFHINLGRIPMLPIFVGYLMVSRGIGHLIEETNSKHFEKARGAAFWLTLLGVVSFLFLWTPYQSGLFSYFSVVFSVLELFLISNLLEGSIEYLHGKGCSNLVNDYRAEQKSYTILQTIFILSSVVVITIADATISFVVILFGLFLRIWFMAMLGRLKRIEEEPAGGGTQPKEPEPGVGSSPLADRYGPGTENWEDEGQRSEDQDAGSSYAGKTKDGEYNTVFHEENDW